jgi:hypothetical protein
MNGVLLALVAAFLAGIGARDQTLLAHLSARGGPRPAWLAVAVATGAGAAILAAWAGAQAAPELAPKLRALLAALALALAGGELCLFARVKPPKEPTNSLGAAAIVLLAHQITDASRLLVFAIAVSWPAAQTALGGALGGGAALVIGWVGGKQFLAATPQLRLARRVSGAILLLSAAFVAWYTLGDVDRFYQSFIAFISARAI